MLHQAFDALFVAALVLPPAAVAICLLLQFIPRGHGASSTVQHPVGA